jgi:4-amino-4-deoxy-L-arabinose transferase-like glycosyltransferase
MAQRVKDLKKQQRMVWPWALFVGLGMVFIAHAPVTPVVIGCVAVILLSMARNKLRDRKAGVPGGSQ